LLSLSFAVINSFLSSPRTDWSLLWVFPATWYQSLSRFFRAQEIVVPTLVMNLIFLVINLGLNILFVHGVNVPALSLKWSGLGFIGSPIATAVTRFSFLLVYIAYMIAYRRLHAQCWPGWRRTAFARARVKLYLSQVAQLSIGACIEEWQLEVVAIFGEALRAQRPINCVLFVCFNVLFFSFFFSGSDDQNFFNHKLCVPSLPATRALLMRRHDA
jgi:Na+-driven multidrug efflux pump